MLKKIKVVKLSIELYMRHAQINGEKFKVHRRVSITYRLIHVIYLEFYFDLLIREKQKQK